MKRLDALVCLGCDRSLPRDAFDDCVMRDGRQRPYERCRGCRAKSGWYSKGRPPLPPPNPSGLCMCGCQKPTPIATRNHREFGHAKGHPVKYIVGHGPHVSSPTLYEVDEWGCWNWLRSKDKNGYGWIGQWNKETKKRKNVGAHVWSYEQHVGPVPEGLFLDHLCCNPSCINPAHLEPVTPSENVLRNGYRIRLAGLLWLRTGERPWQMPIAS